MDIRTDIQPLKLIDVSAAADACCSGADCGCGIAEDSVEGDLGFTGS